jgi:hypothetical protein
MYYVFSLCEASSGTMSFGKIFWNGKEVTLGAGDYSANNKVVSLTTNSTTPQVDTTIDGYAWIYQFNDGSSSGVNTGGTSAITILQNAGIPVSDRWTSTDTMTNTCFMVIKVVYNKDVQDAQQMPRLSVELTNTLTKPGEVLLDYMTDTVYGCAIDVTNIDTASLTALDAYSDQLITYVPVGGGTTTQPRYRIDGPVNTGDNCLSNLQQLVDACDSWLQYSELTGQWTIVINKPYSGVIGDLYSVDSSVLIGGIEINPIDLNQTYNSLEVQYPNANINDQTDYKVVDLTTVGTAWYDPSLLSPNEPDNRLTIQYPQINNYVRAVYLGVRRLLQSREDLTIACNLDYSGIQVVAGDVVRVTLAEYGWTDKLFRVSQVQETKTPDGFLGARITAFEYNSTVYADNALLDFIPEANTGLSDPNIFSAVATPTITTSPLSEGNVATFYVTGTVPATGTVLYLDFNWGTSNNVATHQLFQTISNADGTPLTAGDTPYVQAGDLPPQTYYWSVTARNNQAGKSSASSTSYVWGGPNITTYDPISGLGGVQFDQMGSGTGATNIIGFAGYTVPNNSTNTVTPPIDITTNTTFNVPVYIDGTTVSPTKYYPYFQGTSSTADSYVQNSTASLYPALASLLYIYNGDDNWWLMSYATLYSPSLAGYGLINNSITQLVSDSNTTVQLLSCTKRTTQSFMQALTTNLVTIELLANKPARLTSDTATSGSGTYEAGGVLIRNMVAGTRVTVIYHKLELQNSV